MENQTMAPTMAPTMIPNTNHLDKPGNPSTATSSSLKLNDRSGSDRSNGQPLKVLSEEDWAFWIENGYVIIKMPYPKSRLWQRRSFCGNLKKKTPTTKPLGTRSHVPK
jgi:hypothetical protein